MTYMVKTILQNFSDTIKENYEFIQFWANSSQELDPEKDYPLSDNFPHVFLGKPVGKQRMLGEMKWPGR